jgi:PAS domain S-box-containing protein
MLKGVAWFPAAVVAIAVVVAMIVDFGVVPTGPRPAFESSPALLALMGLYIVAITSAYRLPRSEHIAYTAAGISVLLFALPAYLILSGDAAAAGTDVMLLRRSWLMIVIWVLAFVGMERKRSLLGVESARADLERQVAERTALYKQSAADAQLLGTRLRQAQAIARLGNWERDLHTGKVWWSDETFHLLGLKPGDVEPSFEALLGCLHPDDRPAQHELAEREVNLDKPRSADLRVLLPNGTIRHVQTHSEIVVDDEGRPRKVVGTIQDVTDRRKLELEVAELMQRLDALASAAFDGIVVLEGGLIREVSEGFATKLGYVLHDIVGRPLSDLIAPAFRGKAADIPPAQGLDAYELVFSKRNGETVRMEGFSTRLSAGDRELTIAGFRDVGRRLELEREIVEAAERERERVGYALREQVGQLLVTLKWSLQSLARRLHAGEAGADEAERLVEQIERIIAETNKLSATISPHIPDSLEVFPALKMLAMDVNRHMGANCELRCATAERVDSRETSSHLYRIAEEAVRVAIHSGHARNIELTFARRESLCTLTVIDDGKPVPTGAEADDDRPWRNLHYRARLINGVVEIRRRATGGRQIVCAFPAT